MDHLRRRANFGSARSKDYEVAYVLYFSYSILKLRRVWQAEENGAHMPMWADAVSSVCGRDVS